MYCAGLFPGREQWPPEVLQAKVVSWATPGYRYSRRHDLLLTKKKHCFHNLAFVRRLPGVLHLTVEFQWYLSCYLRKQKSPTTSNHYFNLKVNMTMYPSLKMSICSICVSQLHWTVCTVLCRLSSAVRWSSALIHVRGLPFKSICDRHTVRVNIWGHPTHRPPGIRSRASDVKHSTHVCECVHLYITGRNTADVWVIQLCCSLLSIITRVEKDILIVQLFRPITVMCWRLNAISIRVKMIWLYDICDMTFMIYHKCWVWENGL